MATHKEIKEGERKQCKDQFSCLKWCITDDMFTILCLVQTLKQTLHSDQEHGQAYTVLNVGKTWVYYQIDNERIKNALSPA